MTENSNGVSICIELETKYRENQYDKTATWLKNVQLTQASFRQMLEDTVDQIEEPHIREYLAVMLGHAMEHEQKLKNCLG